MDTRAYLFDPASTAAASTPATATLPDVIDATVASYGTALAAIDGSVRLTWADLDRRAHALAAGLAAEGVRKGDVVGLHAPNGWPFLVATIALARLAAVALPLHPPYRRHELEHLLRFCGAVACIVTAETRANVRGIADACPDLRFVLAAGAGAAGDPDAVSFEGLIAQHDGARAPAVALHANDPISLNATSGTESVRPKICMHAHGGLLGNSAQLARECGIDAGDRVLCTSGFTHLFGTACVQMAFTAGAALVTMERFAAGAWLDLCEREGVTRAWAVPTQLFDILAEQRVRPRTLQLREIRTGGAVISPLLAADVRALLCPRLTIQWGMSEICGGATTRDDETFARPTLGTPLAGAEVRAVDANGTDCAAGGVGELLYRRADVFRGYLGEPELTAATIAPGGWVRTGDLVALAPDGSLDFHGRAKDVINRGGYKIGAQELEVLLLTLPAIRQLAVIAVADERLGEQTALVCSLHAGHTLALADVSAHLDALAVAKFKWPEHLIVLDALPATPTGKIAKQRVRDIVAGLHAAESSRA